MAVMLTAFIWPTLCSSAFAASSICIPVKPSQEKIRLIVAQDQQVRVKGNFLVKSYSDVEVYGVLVVEGDIRIYDRLSLMIAGNGKVVVSGNVTSFTSAQKEFTIQDQGEFIVMGLFTTGTETVISIAGNSVMSMDAILADSDLVLRGDGKILSNHCGCSCGDVERKRLCARISVPSKN